MMNRLIRLNIGKHETKWKRILEFAAERGGNKLECLAVTCGPASARVRVIESKADDQATENLAVVHRVEKSPLFSQHCRRKIILRSMKKNNIVPGWIKDPTVSSNKFLPRAYALWLKGQKVRGDRNHLVVLNLPTRVSSLCLQANQWAHISKVTVIHLSERRDKIEFCECCQFLHWPGQVAWPKF